MLVQTKTYRLVTLATEVVRDCGIFSLTSAELAVIAFAAIAK
jgi:hypothetical protein